MSEVLVEQVSVSAEEDARRRARFPVGALLALEDLSDAGRESAVDALREVEPVSWVPAIGGWVVTSREGMRASLKRDFLTVESSANLVRASLGRMMLTVDGEEHDRLRKPIERPFKPVAVQQSYGTAIEELVDSLIDDFVGSGRTQLDTSFASPFAVRMAGTALGLSLGEVTKIDGIYAALAGGMVYDGDPAPLRLAESARAELDAILHDELERNRTHPGLSLTSELVHDSEGLTDEEIVGQLRVVMFGAIETIQASVLTILYLLLRHRDQLDLVLSDPDLVGNAHEEARRLVPPVAMVERWTRVPVDLLGVDIPAGEFVMVSILGANRDPLTFDDPTTFDVLRRNAHLSMSFSFGVHACLGIHLARLQTTIALRQLLTRLPGLELVSAEPPAGFAFRRPSDVVVRWDA